jgi:hypothetical protein
VFAFVNVFAVFVHSGYTFQYGNEGILQVSWIVGDLSHGMGQIVHGIDNALESGFGIGSVTFTASTHLTPCRQGLNAHNSSRMKSIIGATMIFLMRGIDGQQGLQDFEIGLDIDRPLESRIS